MADNVAISAGTGTNIATDDITTLNGGAQAAGTSQAQRVKPGYGDDGIFRDVSDAFPFPVKGGQANAGSMSTPFTFTAVDVAVAAPDGTGTLVSGTPSAGSMSSAFAVADGLVASLFLVKGLAVSQTALTVYFEGSRNSTNGTDGDWVELKQRRTGTQPGVETADYKTQSNGYFRGNCAGFAWLRARLLGTPFSAGVSVQIATSAGQGATFFNSGLPGGAATIGAVTAPNAAALALDGTDISAPTAMPAGGVGIRGWLSAIWTKLNGSIAVTGTFFQATQPVSIAATITDDVTDRAGRLLGVLSTGANTIGAVNIAAAQTVAVTQATAANLNATVAQAAITKGTQGATGVTTQDLKDAGRGLVTYYTLIPVLTSATDTLLSLTGTKGAATVTATTTPAVVTAGKTFRIQRFAATYISTATSGYGVARLRYNTGGAVLITSPVLKTIAVGSSAPVTANAADTEDASVPDGTEVPAGTGIGISIQGFSGATATAVGYVFCTVSGYEY